MQTEAILDNSEENKKRGSLASNISNFSRGGAVGAALFWVKLNMPQPDLQKADSGRHLTHNVKAKDGKSQNGLVFFQLWAGGTTVETTLFHGPI